MEKDQQIPLDSKFPEYGKAYRFLPVCPLAARRGKIPGMKRPLHIFPVLALMSCLAPALALAQGDDALGGGVSIRCDAPLRFGQIINCQGGGTLTLPPSGGAARTTGCVTAATGTSGHGLCRMEQGRDHQMVQVMVSNPAIELADGANSMVVDEFKLRDGGDSITVTDIAVTIPVGARLNIRPSQPPGFYSGAVSITILTE